MMFLTVLVITIPFVLTEIILVNLKSYYMMVFHCIFFAIILFSIFKGGCTDPGIVPRQLGSNKNFKSISYNVVII